MKKDDNILILSLLASISSASVDGTYVWLCSFLKTVSHQMVAVLFKAVFKSDSELGVRIQFASESGSAECGSGSSYLQRIYFVNLTGYNHCEGSSLSRRPPFRAVEAHSRAMQLLWHHRGSRLGP